MPFKDPEQQREYQRQWIANRRAAYFADKCCVRCGSTEDLRLDHIDPAQKINHRIWSWSEERRNAELAKCQVLCYTCHRNKTDTEQIRGEQKSTSILTEDDVREIRRQFASGVQGATLAERYGVHRNTIYGVIYTTWRHVT